MGQLQKVKKWDVGKRRVLHVRGELVEDETFFNIHLRVWEGDGVSVGARRLRSGVLIAVDVS
ncbi:MAG: hypothetical protein ACOVO0_15765 [Burkholderiaceae bacterium]|jgi:hypothetical protein